MEEIASTVPQPKNTRRKKVLATILAVESIATAGFIAYRKTPSVHAANTVNVVTDNFTRTTSTWTSANLGGTYTYTGTSTDFNTNGLEGTMLVPSASNQRIASLPSISARDTESKVRVKTDKLTSGGQFYASEQMRDGSSGTYRATLMFDAGKLYVFAQKYLTSTGLTYDLTSRFDVGVNHTANSYVWLKSQVVGVSPTVINIKVWADGTAEPASWQYTYSDSAADQITTPGYVSILSRINGNTDLPVLFTYDDYSVNDLNSTVAPTVTPLVTPQVTPTPTPAGIYPVGQTGSWNLVFQDEFNGTSLDSTKWWPCFWGWNQTTGCTGSGELEWYKPQNITVANGLLTLTAKKETVVGTNGVTYNYTSGMVTTGRSGTKPEPLKFPYTYGHAEVRAKVPAGRGLWPAFWSVAPYGDYTTNPLPELDTLELLGHQPNVAYLTNHSPESGTTTVTGPDYSQDFHTFAADWEPGVIVWYIDGVEKKRFVNSAVTQNSMYIILNLAVGGSWPGAPDATTVFPARFDIDYIRVWQKGTGSTPTPSPIPSSTPMPTATPTLGPTAIPSPTPTSGPADISSPTVTVTSPLPNSLVARNSTVTISANATDNVGVTKVLFYVDNVLKCTDTTASYTCAWNVPAQKNKTYTIRAEAYDAANNRSSASVVVTSL